MTHAHDWEAYDGPVPGPDDEPPGGPEDEPDQSSVAGILQITARPDRHAVELEAFLDAAEPPRATLVDDVLDPGDRVILTGREGGGKSTLLRQIGVQVASGIHPFTLEEVTPARVLLVDLENPRRLLKDRLRSLRLAAGDRYPGTFEIDHRPEGADLTSMEGQRELRRVITAAEPQLILIGPLYKLANGDPNDEVTARAVAGFLDRIRAETGAALMMEAHTPHAAGGGTTRAERPYGASLWMRWPEFGLFLDPDTGALRHWRGPRDERAWPSALTRGGSWPWTPITRPRDVLWLRIVDVCEKAGEQLAQRDLAELLNTSKGNVQRAIEEHRREYDAIGPSTAKPQVRGGGPE